MYAPNSRDYETTNARNTKFRMTTHYNYLILTILTILGGIALGIENELAPSNTKLACEVPGYFLSSYQSNNKSCDHFVMAKVKGQTEVKLGKTGWELYLDALLPQLEGSLHNSNCSDLPRPKWGQGHKKGTQLRPKSLDGSGPVSPAFTLNLS